MVLLEALASIPQETTINMWQPNRLEQERLDKLGELETQGVVGVRKRRAEGMGRGVRIT